MEYIAYIIFWILLPATAIFYRYKKRIKTGFAIGAILTSIFIGFLGAHTLEEPAENRFVRLMNEKKYEEAEKAFAWIVQSNPEEVKKYRFNLPGDSDKFKEIKRRLERKYVGIAEKIIDQGRVRNIKTCEGLISGRKKLKELENALRLVQMAETLGSARSGMREQLKRDIKHSKSVLNDSKDICK